MRDRHTASLGNDAGRNLRANWESPHTGFRLWANSKLRQSTPSGLRRTIDPCSASSPKRRPTNPSSSIRRPSTEAVAAVEIVVPVYNEATDLAASIERLHRYLTERFPLSWRDHHRRQRVAPTDVAHRVPARPQLERCPGRAPRRQGPWSCPPHACGPRAPSPSWPTWTSISRPTSMHCCPSSRRSSPATAMSPIGTRLAPGGATCRGPKREVISAQLQPDPQGRPAHAASPMRSAASRRCAPTSPARCCPLIEDEGWFFDTELLVLAEHNGLRIHEVPVDWVDDPDTRVRHRRDAPRRPQGRVADVRRLRPGSRLDPKRHPARPLPDRLGEQLVRFCVHRHREHRRVRGVVLRAGEPLGRPRRRREPGDLARWPTPPPTAASPSRCAAARRRPPSRRRPRRHGLPLTANLLALGVLGATGQATVPVMVLTLTAVNARRRPRPLRPPAQRRSSGAGSEARLRPVVRYGAVSLVATTTSLVVLGRARDAAWVTPGWANVIATGAGTIPSFELNRRWVWAKRGTRSLSTEVIPFTLCCSPAWRCRLSPCTSRRPGPTAWYWKPWPARGGRARERRRVRVAVDHPVRDPRHTSCSPTGPPPLIATSRECVRHPAATLRISGRFTDRKGDATTLRPAGG